MTFGALLGVFGALCLVLGLIALATRVARGPAPRTSQELPMRVLSRVALGPKQGLAAVRVGERILVVSVGDGGVRTVLELDPDDDEAVETALAPVALPGRSAPGLGRLSPVFARILRGAAVLAGALAVTAALALRPTPATAQAGATVPATGAVTAPQQPAAATAAPGTAASRQSALTSLGAALPSMQLQVGDPDDGLRMSGTVGTVLVIGLLTLLPTLLLLMTSFTRVLVVLHFLRQAIGTQTAPPSQMVAALALLITGFVMAPTLSRVNQVALKPWMDGTIDEVTMMKEAVVPFRTFMLDHVRESDLATFVDLSGGPAPETVDDIPLVTLVSAFAISELRTAFQIGFVLFLPFLVIDLVVASVLMSLGMFMLPPVMVSLPFKLLLFVLVDGWALVVHSVVASFG